MGKLVFLIVCFIAGIVTGYLCDDRHETTNSKISKYKYYQDLNNRMRRIEMIVKQEKETYAGKKD